MVPSLPCVIVTGSLGTIVCWVDGELVDCIFADVASDVPGADKVEVIDGEVDTSLYTIFTTKIPMLIIHRDCIYGTFHLKTHLSAGG